MKGLATMIEETPGVVSSKRVMGCLLVVAGVADIILLSALGHPEAIGAASQSLIWPGCALLGVTPIVEGLNAKLGGGAQ